MIERQHLKRAGTIWIIISVIALVLLFWANRVKADEDTIGPVRFGPMLTAQMIRMKFNPTRTSFMTSGLGGGFFAEYQAKEKTAFKPRVEVYVLASSREESKELDIEFGCSGSLLSIGPLQLGNVGAIYNPDENEWSLTIGGSLTLWGKEL